MSLLRPSIISYAHALARGLCLRLGGRLGIVIAIMRPAISKTISDLRDLYPTGQRHDERALRIGV
jgi:hypothetical protein